MSLSLLDVLLAEALLTHKLSKFFKKFPSISFVLGMVPFIPGSMKLTNDLYLFITFIFLNVVGKRHADLLRILYSILRAYYFLNIRIVELH